MMMDVLMIDDIKKNINYLLLYIVVYYQDLIYAKFAIVYSTKKHKQKDSKIDSNNNSPSSNINSSKEDCDLQFDLKNESKRDSKTDQTNEVSVSVVVNEGTVLAHSANETKEKVENGAESNLEEETVSNESEK
ncbi:Hypothetical_protein [Hexamita inflata]|uniref:Hypothetical_protein n=1 Tax=Hexamita inflata TaxID=28002 RepID=A0ABP1GMI4_9EUKA